MHSSISLCSPHYRPSSFASVALDVKASVTSVVVSSDTDDDWSKCDGLTGSWVFPEAEFSSATWRSAHVSIRFCRSFCSSSYLTPEFVVVAFDSPESLFGSLLDKMRSRHVHQGSNSPHLRHWSRLIAVLEKRSCWAFLIAFGDLLEPDQKSFVDAELQ